MDTRALVAVTRARGQLYTGHPEKGARVQYERIDASVVDRVVRCIPASLYSGAWSAAYDGEEQARIVAIIEAVAPSA